MGALIFEIFGCYDLTDHKQRFLGPERDVYRVNRKSTFAYDRF